MNCIYMCSFRAFWSSYSMVFTAILFLPSLPSQDTQAVTTSSQATIFQPYQSTGLGDLTPQQTEVCNNITSPSEIYLNSLAPQRCGSNLKSKIFKLFIQNNTWGTQVYATEPHWWDINIGSGNGLVALSKILQLIFVNENNLFWFEVLLKGQSNNKPELFT